MATTLLTLTGPAKSRSTLSLEGDLKNPVRLTAGGLSGNPWGAGLQIPEPLTGPR